MGGAGPVPGPTATLGASVLAAQLPLVAEEESADSVAQPRAAAPQPRPRGHGRRGWRGLAWAHLSQQRAPQRLT